MTSFRLILVLTLIGFMGLGLWASFGLVSFGARPANPLSQKSIYFEVTKGMSREKIARALESDGIITSARKFLWLGRATRNWGRLKAAEYELSANMSPIDVFKVLTSGMSVTFPVTIVEGDNMYQVAEKLQAKKLVSRETFLKSCRNTALITSLDLNTPPPPTVEGYLFPNTYNFPRKITAEEVIRKMVAEFKSEWTPQFNEALKRSGLTRHQLITLASIVEKETGAPEERPLIASIFHNRMKKKMRLESDPTTIYGVWDRYNGNLTRAHLAEVNSYNTYRIPGLPVGPISNPGKEAIAATLNPAQSGYLFFVSHNDGTHEFTSNYKDHSAAVRRFQLDPKAREGKSWRDLQTKRVSH